MTLSPANIPATIANIPANIPATIANVQETVTRPKPIAPVPREAQLRPASDADIHYLLSELEQEPGIYAASDIYTYYQSICAQAGRRSMPQRSLGVALRAQGYRSVRLNGNTIRAWIITDKES